MIGTPGSINTSTNAKGETLQTHIGNDGMADVERHHTDHKTPNAHTNPHDHYITWEGNHPNFSSPVNYTDGAPDFGDVIGGMSDMNGKIILGNTIEQNRFTGISDFKWSLKCGGEIEFRWNGKDYGVFRINDRYLIAWDNGKSEARYNEIDELLDFTVGSDRLRDVVSDIMVLARTV